MTNYREQLADHLPQYRAALGQHAEAILEHTEAQVVRDRAADTLVDAQARAQLDPANAASVREARAAAVHLATLPELEQFRGARDGYTWADGVLKRTRVVERGEREILRSLRVLAAPGGEGE